MDARSTNLTTYFQEVQRRANLQDLNLDARTPHIRVDAHQVRAGQLEERWTNALFYLAAEARKPKSHGKASQLPDEIPAPPQDAKPIDILISVVSLEQARATVGLALLPASLDRDGRLSADVLNTEPWIPASRLHTDGTSDQEVMVGDLVEFWKWRREEGKELTSRVEDFDGAFRLATRMFDAVATRMPTQQGSELPTGRLEREMCVVSLGSIITANKPIIDLYEYLLHPDTEVAPLYEALLRLDQRPRRHSDGLDEHPAFLAESARRACGSMGGSFPLTPSQRRAVHAFLDDGDGDVTAVSGPPGTGKTTMLQSVVATLIVRHALDGLPAPLVLGTSTNNQAVTNIIDSFSSVAPDEPGVLDQRWLLAADAPDKDSAEQLPSQPLRGLAVYCPAESKVAGAKAKGYLVEKPRKDGVYTAYSEKTYVDACLPAFLTAVGRYATEAGFTPPASLADAATLLKRALDMCDAARLSIIDARARADQLVRTPIDTLRSRAESGRAELARHHHRLADWRTHLAAVSPGGVLDPVEDQIRVQMNQRPDEPAQGLTSCAAYVGFYEDRVAEIGVAVDRDLAAIRTAEAAETAALDEFRTEAAMSLRVAQRVGLISEDHLTMVSGARTMLQLDEALDVSLRYAEFWLAVHHYEAAWLTMATNEELVPRDDRWQNKEAVQDLYWSQVSSLTPCFVMTAYQVPKYFSLYARKGERSNFDLGRADLLIIDEAGQVDSSLGAAVFSVAKRALVVGDEHQLAPVWGIDPVSDEEMARINGLGDTWDTMRDHGLTGSDHSSVMRAASHASRWSYGPDQDPGLFLAEHFRCHPQIIGYCNELLYKGLLDPRRPLAGYKLDGWVASPFLFHEVLRSKDQPRGSSRENPVEAEAVATWIKDNFETFRGIYNPGQDPEKDKAIIGVVTPFAAQARLIESTLKAEAPQFAPLITVGTAHRLQGAERPVVLFSSVYGDNSGSASFVDGTLELMNVAVSRAKDLFVVFGGRARWADQGPVFSLVRRFATREAASEEQAVGEVAGDGEGAASELGRPAETEPVPESVDRHEPDYLIASELLKVFREDGTIPAEPVLKASHLNKALEVAGLLRRDEANQPLPTDQGRALGITVYKGGSADKPYVSPIYSPAAQEALRSMIVAGELSLEA